MVQLKYFGDSRDYFKYDLITSVIEGVPFGEYVFIPMLTYHREDNEGKKKIAKDESKRLELRSFIQRCQDKNLRHWETWLKRYVEYHTINDVDTTYFYDSDKQRRDYWNEFEQWLNLRNALIFLDPDTGLETGKPSYLKKQGREKYLLNNELSYLVGSLDETSAIMIYQHMQRNRNLHESMAEKKLRQIKDNCRDTFVSAYREDDLAFLFVTKAATVNRKIYDTLTVYCRKSGKKRKKIYPRCPS